MEPWNGNFELVDPRDIHFDSKYQRPQKWDLISAIAAEPTWLAFGVVLCSKREYAGGTLWALDGQQRVNGLMTTEDPPSRVPVIWFPVKTVREEARLFDIVNTNRKSVASLEKFRARVTGENVTYVRIQEAVSRAGYSIGANTESARTVAAVGGLEAMYNALGEDGITTVLGALAEAWPDDTAGTSATMLRAVTVVASEMEANGGLTVEKLSKALARTSPGRILRKSEEIRFAQGGSKGDAVRKAIAALAKV